MRSILFALFLITTVFATPDTALSQRWYRNLYAINGSYWSQSDSGYREACRLAASAAQSGFNGVELPIHYFFKSWNSAAKTRFKNFTHYAESLGLEIIPEVFPLNSAGLLFNRDFAEADPIDSLPLLAIDGKLSILPDNIDRLRNGDLELFTGNSFTSYLFSDKPGIVSFSDSNDGVGNSACIRFENLSANNGMARLCQEVALRPNSQYRLSFKVKRDGFTMPVSALILGKHYGNEIQRMSAYADSGDLKWATYRTEFTTGEYDTIRFYIGVWGAIGNGRFYLDDLSIRRSTDLSGIVRRKDTPVKLSNRHGVIMTEGIDYATVANLAVCSTLTIPPSSLIKENDTLMLTCHRAADYHGYKALCLSHEPVFAEFKLQMDSLHALYPFRKCFLYIDEIRCMAACGTCRATSRDASAILGHAAHKMYASLKAINPAITVYTWADMFDTAWNARNHYYKVRGNLNGSWDSLPKDMQITVWGECENATDSTFLSRSMERFASRGHTVMGCGYYDTGNLKGTSKWISLLLAQPAARGLLYATWSYPPDYSMLQGFGALMLDSLNSGSVTKESAPHPSEASIVLRAFPNPLSTGCEIQLPSSIRDPVAMQIHSLRGELIRELHLNSSEVTSGHVYWDTCDRNGIKLGSGCYLVSLNSKGLILKTRTVLIR
ncbi:MAG: hypothetical protein JNL74_14345 [Fibrobacteres bacterium]|nr:hypothetical protein [Fibrobacterota bacterium]